MAARRTIPPSRSFAAEQRTHVSFLAREVVELGAIPLSLPQHEVSQLAQDYMQKTDVLHLAESVYPSLSGGEKQRLHLARC